MVIAVSPVDFEYLSTAHRGSQRVKRQSQSLHGCELGGQHRCCGCVAWYAWGTSKGVSLTRLPWLGTLFLLLGGLAQSSYEDLCLV